MPKYLVQASYSVEGYRGLLKEGGTKRREALEGMIKSAGGKLEALYYAYGGDDAYLILDFPDSVSMSAVSLVVNASGVGRSKTTVLITPEEVDQAVAKSASVGYRPPEQ